MKLNTSKPEFADRLRNYSRVVSAKLEFNRQTAGKIAGLSAAAGMALSAHHAAEAAINYSGPVNLNVSVSGGYQQQIASFNMDGLANFGLSAFQLGFYSYYGARAVGFGTTGSVNSTGNPGPKGEQIVFAPNFGGYSYWGGVYPDVNRPDQLAGGALIDSNSPWFAPAINGPGNQNKGLIAGSNYSPFIPGWNWDHPTGPFASGTGFAGVRFDCPTSTTGGADKHYGWVRLQLTNAGNGRVTSLTVLDWAYEDTCGATIHAGEIPEPSSALLGALGALALGASGVRSQRRRRKKLAV